MSREIIPFHADDVSALARALKREFARHDEETAADPARRKGPGHVELLNMLARATGFRNFQHMRAQADARERLDHPPVTVEPAVDYVRIERLARYFDAAGRLTRWPGKHSDRLACLWVLWSRMEPRRVFERGRDQRRPQRRTSVRRSCAAAPRTRRPRHDGAHGGRSRIPPVSNRRHPPRRWR